MSLAKLKEKILTRAYLVARASLTTIAIEIGVLLLVVAIIIGKVAMPIFMGTNTSGWDATTIIIWGIVPIVAFVVIILLLLRQVRGGEIG
jgi:uncharacterized protein (DUF983 family)